MPNPYIPAPLDAASIYTGASIENIFNSSSVVPNHQALSL